MPSTLAGSSSSASNPAHILIARTNRISTPQPTLTSPADPLPSHIAAAGLFPKSSNSPPWLFEEIAADEYDQEGAEETTEPIEIDPTFTREGKWPGTVKIVVEATTFWTHKDILVFSSPFFEAALSGGWSETSDSQGRPLSMSSIITISQPPVIPGELSLPTTDESTVVTFAPSDHSQGSEVDSSDETSNSSLRIHVTEPSDAAPSTDNAYQGSPTMPTFSNNGWDNQEAEVTEEERTAARVSSLEKLQGSMTAEASTPRLSKPQFRKKRRSKGIEGVIILKEERANIFHDFLKFVYPHLECTISWNNVEGLMNLSDKLCVPSLTTACLAFLLSHAAGKPIKAMRIAELFGHDELYKESSRFVLDNPGGWSETEMSTLSKETLLKLERRRNWFLERVLKLGLVSIAKEYQCCITCPDPSACAKLLDEKWKQSYHALFRFGPAQPSMVFRYLRSLEGVGSPLALTQLACQNHAKQWVATLFDRMFSLGVRGSGTDATPLTANSRVPAAAINASSSVGPRRHFLYCSLRPEVTPPKNKAIRARDALNGLQVNIP